MVNSEEQEALTVKVLGERLGVLEAKIKANRSSHNRLQEKVNRHGTLLERIDERKAVELLDSLVARISELSSKFQIEILKQCVCSEVSRLFPHLFPLIIEALDKSNDYWDGGKDLTIKQWSKRLPMLRKKHGAQLDEYYLASIKEKRDRGHKINGESAGHND